MTRPLLAALAACALAPSAPAADPPAKPNVLFIAIDDLRDWVGYLGHKPAKTPNLDRLAARGVAFTRSYCASPVCNPSRTALLTGRRPSTTGVYENNIDWRTQPEAASVPRLPQHFKANGYYVATAGKIWHGGYPAPDADWSDFRPKGKGDPSCGEGEQPKKNRQPAAAGELWGYGNFRIGPTAGGDEQMADYANVSYCVKQLEKRHDKPLFLACGISKPHLPFTAPKKYFDMFPLDQIQLPEVKEDDLADVPPVGVKLAKRSGDHAAITKAGKWKEAVQAYLAAIAFCDAMVGRVLDALDRSPHKDNTVVMLWSDHGWTLGEKEHWRKFALWEEPTRSPLIVIAPGVTKPGVCHRTVDFMSLYPTLCDLCGVPLPGHLEGVSFKPLLADPAAAWDRPAVCTYLFGNHTVRTERWRYIKYVDGGEELYDHEADPKEWTNLANDPKHAATKAELAKWLPKVNKPDPGKRKN